MSIGYCEKHDLLWDMDKTDDCPDCEDEPVSSNKHTQDLERALAKSERALTAETQRRVAAEAVVRDLSSMLERVVKDFKLHIEPRKSPLCKEAETLLSEIGK